MSERISLPKHIPGLNGLRGLAVTAVFLFHSSYVSRLHILWLSKYGWVGVDLFFVLSGFLITRILLETRSRSAGQYFGLFYLRRALRIWPLYFAVLVLLFGVYPHFRPETSLDLRHYRWWYYALYIQNLSFGDWGVLFLGHTWSLAVEEQFYLVWPFVIFLFSESALAFVLPATFVGALLVRAFGHWLGPPEFFQYTFTGCRIDALSLGALAALLLRFNWYSPARWRVLSVAALVIGLPVSIAALWQRSFMTFWWAYPFIALSAAGVIGITVTPSRYTMWLRHVLATRPLEYGGKISYGIYLLHLPVIGLVEIVARKFPGYFLPGMVGAAEGFLFEAGSVMILAMISWHFFERPILTLRDRYFSKSAAPQSFPSNHFFQAITAIRNR